MTGTLMGKVMQS